jgi:hypothetical protein
LLDVITPPNGRGRGGRLIPIRLDTTSPITIKGAAARIAADHPETGLFALINGAMQAHAGPVEWLQARDIQKVMEVRARTEESRMRSGPDYVAPRGREFV